MASESTGKKESASAESADAVAEIILYLLSENGGAELELRYGPGGVEGIRELLSLFGQEEGGSFDIDAEQVASPTLKAALAQLVARNASTTPQLHRLKKFVCDLPDDQHFLLLPGRPQSTAAQLEAERHLAKLNCGAEAADVGTGTLFGPLLERYDLHNPRTDRSTMIGARPKAERTCRFCSRSAAQGATFKSVAHAIPTALGNDHLKLAEECDECNNYFGRMTEPSLIAMLNIPRVFLGTQGRGKNGGRPEIRFRDGQLAHDGDKLMVQSRNVTHDQATGQLTVELGAGPAVVPLAVYRALVKIALSVVDKSVLPALRDTIDWVRHAHHQDRPLPKVATAIIDLPPNPSAQIVVYRRKAPHPRLPHLIGEFRLGCFIYVFAVPFSKDDAWNLIGFFDDADFKQTFKHYAAAADWTQHDLSATSKVALKPTLHFNPAP